MKQVKIIRSADREWTEKHTDGCSIPLFEQILTKDEKTGMEISVAHYPAGYNTVLHRHTIAHGIYVLSGCLKTSAGLFEQGDYIWFPEGTDMEHGAPEDQDCTVLFITNGPFNIEYVLENDNDSAQPSIDE